MKIETIGSALEAKPEWTQIDDSVCSNIDGIVDLDVEKRLTKEDIIATYPGRNFYAYVWYDKQEGVFIAAVWEYGQHRSTAKATTVENLRLLISGEYGFE